jgi:Na+-translocating ferredoxin:NAD+ oxidoreductase RnfC subunit
MNLADIAKKGIVGAGGAGFPAHIKLAARPEFLIMNAAECEPLLHKDMELLRTFPDEIMAGFEMAMQITGASEGIIGIKGKHRDIITMLSPKLKDNMSLVEIDDFYPAGDEITLIYLATDRIVQPGELPITAGCIVQNVETLYNMTLANPVVDKYLTVAGAVASPATIKVPVGTTFADVLSRFEITTANYAVRSGGLMMGELEKDLDSVVTKCTGGLIVLPADHYCVTMYERYATEHATDILAKAGCDQCNFCTEFCPRYLLGHPVRPETAMRNRMFTREGEPFVDLGSDFCCECNLCTLYACPESLDPKGATVIEKRMLGQLDRKWEGLPVSVHPMMEYRKVPTIKLMQRLDVVKYKDGAPCSDLVFLPDRVAIPLSQHIGAPAIPVVSEDDPVEKFALLARADGEISANIHASISGRVTRISATKIEIQRMK